MVDDRGLSSLEERIGAVDQWISRMVTTGEVGRMQPELLRGVLEVYGADFDISPEARKSLGKYTNKSKADGIRAVWGDQFAEYKTWASEYVAEYEARTGIELPKLDDSGKKTSGMIQFFGELTSFAAGAMTFEDFKHYTEARVHNGQAWAEGRKGDRIKVKVPTASEPIFLSSVPPEFPKLAWDEIKSWKK